MALVDEGYGFAEVRSWAWMQGPEVFANFLKKVEYLANYGCTEDEPDRVLCYVARDGSSETDLSFCWHRKQADGTYARWMNGGMIYRENEQDWGVHT